MVFPALFDSGHAAWSVGTLGVLAVPILAVWSVAAAAPALRERAVRAAVIVVAGWIRACGWAAIYMKKRVSR